MPHVWRLVLGIRLLTWVYFSCSANFFALHGSKSCRQCEVFIEEGFFAWSVKGEAKELTIDGCMRRWKDLFKNSLVVLWWNLKAGCTIFLQGDIQYIFISIGSHGMCKLFTWVVGIGFGLASLSLLLSWKFA